MSVSPTTAYLTYDNGKIYVNQSQTLSTDVGSHSFTLTVDAWLYSKPATGTITVVITSDCVITSLISPTLSSMAVKVSQSATKNVAFADTIGNSHTDITWCGARTYSVASTPAATFFTVTGTTFTAAPTLVAHAGSYSVTLTVGLASFPAISTV